MTCAPPIVSHEANFLTRFFYLSICLTEYASDKVTAKGNPSGMATTMIETARIRYLRTSWTNFMLHPSGIRSLMMSLIVKATNTMMAAPTPSFPILWTRRSSLSYSGVYYSLFSSKICSLSFPAVLSLPTTSTSILMKPLVRLVPLIKMGLEP